MTALRPGLPRRKQRPSGGSLVIAHISVCGTSARPSISAVCYRHIAAKHRPINTCRILYRLAATRSLRSGALWRDVDNQERQ